MGSAGVGGQIVMTYSLGHVGGGTAGIISQLTVLFAVAGGVSCSAIRSRPTFVMGAALTLTASPLTVLSASPRLLRVSGSNETRRSISRARPVLAFSDGLSRGSGRHGEVSGLQQGGGGRDSDVPDLRRTHRRQPVRRARAEVQAAPAPGTHRAGVATAIFAMCVLLLAALDAPPATLVTAGFGVGVFGGCCLLSVWRPLAASMIALSVFSALQIAVIAQGHLWMLFQGAVVVALKVILFVLLIGGVQAGLRIRDIRRQTRTGDRKLVAAMIAATWSPASMLGLWVRHQEAAGLPGRRQARHRGRDAGVARSTGPRKFDAAWRPAHRRGTWYRLSHAFDGEPAAAEGGQNETNLPWLLRLRWGALAGQLLTIVFVRYVMRSPLPIASLFGLLAISLLTSVAWQLRPTGLVIRSSWLGAVMVLDVLLLTGLLYFTGGPINPFSFLYLVQIALAAVILRPRVDLGAGGAVAGGSACCSSGTSRWCWASRTPSTCGCTCTACGSRSASARRSSSTSCCAFAARSPSARAELQARATWWRGRSGWPRWRRWPPARRTSCRRRWHHRGGRQGAGARARAADGETGAASHVAEDVQLIRAQVERCRAILERMAPTPARARASGCAPATVDELVARLARGPARRGRVRADVDPRCPRCSLRVPPRAVAQALRGVLKNAQDASPAERRGRPDRRAARTAPSIRDRRSRRGHAARGAGARRRAVLHDQGAGRGMGLGLFLARAVVERLGGELRLDSERGPRHDARPCACRCRSARE